MDALLELFLPDAELTVVRGGGPPSRYRGHPELARVPGLLDPFEATLHAVLAHDVRFVAGGARGDVAMAAHHLRRERGAGEAVDLVLHGRYRDEYARGADGRWRFAGRRLEIAWSEERRVRWP